MPKIPFFLVALLALMQSMPSANAQSIQVPKDAAFVVRADLEKLRETELGKKLFDASKKLAGEEFGDGKEPDEAFEDVEKALGFDPFEELRKITVVGRDFDDPMNGLQVVVGLGETTGNLEGLLLALPGYKSSKHDGYPIHSVSPDGNLRLYGAIHGKRTKSVVVATESDDTKRMIDALDKDASTSSGADHESNVHSGSLLTIHLKKIPNVKGLQGPTKTIARLLERVTLSVSEAKRELHAKLLLDTADDKHAQQLQQLAQGLVAMVQIMRNSDDTDEDLRMIAKLTLDLEVTRDGNVVELDIVVPEQMVIDFLRDEVELPLAK